MQIGATIPESNHYFNTTREVNPQLSTYIKAAEDNEKVVLEIFRYYPEVLFTPYEVYDIMIKYLGEEKVLITSVRRAITVLTKNGHLEQTETKKPGPKGRDNLTWRLRAIYQSSSNNAKMNISSKLPEEDKKAAAQSIAPVVENTPVETNAEVEVVTSDELPFTDAEIVPLSPVQEMEHVAENVNVVVRKEIKDMFAGYNLGDKHEAAMITMAKFFDNTFVMVEKFKEKKDEYTVKDISEAKLKSGVAKAFKKTIADTRIGLSKSVKELENKYKNSIAYETTMIKILSQGFKMFETTFKAMEAELEVSVNFEATYNMAIAQEIRQKRFSEIESLGVMQYVDPVILAKVEKLDAPFYEKFLSDAQVKKAEMEAVEEQKRKEKEASDLYNSRMRMLNDIYHGEHPIKNKLLLNMSHDDWSMLLTEMSNYATKMREEKERATPPPPPVSANNPFDTPAPTPSPSVQNGGYVPNKNINPSDSFWTTPSAPANKPAPSSTPASTDSPFEQISDSPFVPTQFAHTATPPQSQQAPPPPPPVAPVSQQTPPPVTPATAPAVPDSPEYINDKDKLQSLIATLSLPPVTLDTPRAYQKYMEILTKFNGFKAWAINEVILK